VPEPDPEVFAGELQAGSRPRPPGEVARALGRAVRVGAVAGLLPNAAVLAVYFARYHELPLPWGKLASTLAAYALGTGISLAVVIQALVLACDRIARIGFGLIAIANPIVAGVLGGAVGGIGPGAFAVTVFGGYHGPIVGTELVTAAILAGAALIALPLARPAAPARIAAAAILGGLIVSLIVVAIVPFLHEEELRSAVYALGPGPVGALAGLIGGATLGLYVGLVIAIARTSWPGRARRQP
jgi:hypothetical protein